MDRSTYLNRKMVFLNFDAPCRTDKEFSQQVYKDHIKGNTPLSQLEFGMVTNVPIDYMHCACLGVCRKLLFMWRDGSRVYRLNSKFCNGKIISLAKYWPSEFNRKPRALSDLEN